MRRILAISICCILTAGVLLSGCSTYQFVTPAANWQTFIGQLQYTSPKRSIIGDTVVRQLGTDQFQCDFLAGPGLPILSLRKDGKRGRAEAAFARVSWQGDADHPVGPLKSWFALPDIFAQATALKGTTVTALQSDKPGFWSAQAQVQDGNLVALKIEFLRSKERFFFHFTR
jgi:hypothetical protein